MALNEAIFSESGRRVRIDTEKDHHSAASITTGGGGSDVMTTTIDDLVRRYVPSARTPIVIKLDVEGVETEAIKGASTVLGRNMMLIYEDHGNEPTAGVTTFVLGQPGLRVYFATDAETVLPISSAASAQAVKTDRRKGYNFFAVSVGSEMDRHFQRLVDGDVPR